MVKHGNRLILEAHKIIVFKMSLRPGRISGHVSVKECCWTASVRIMSVSRRIIRLARKWRVSAQFPPCWPTESSRKYEFGLCIFL